MNKEKESETWLADYDPRIADAKKRVSMVIVPEAEVSVMQFYDNLTLKDLNSKLVWSSLDAVKIRRRNWPRGLKRPLNNNKVTSTV
ncbi:hypothetical protein MKY66_19400 [Paenibacillus sp. FSL R5-0766]|uniref:hypothetical protein n=1 Tax=unclassified Paenibacillus TaxID=185978 RepID=UPI00096F7ADB|nr:hypothetical protein [Paenibacillus sp. FSL R5-0765]OMF60737.1 hypothetical protein BK141_22610 [Paenibacillus sp. FSL R5-0765]